MNKYVHRMYILALKENLKLRCRVINNLVDHIGYEIRCKFPYSFLPPPVAIFWIDHNNDLQIIGNANEFECYSL